MNTIIVTISILVKNLLMLNIMIWMKTLRQFLKLLTLKLLIEKEFLSLTMFLTKTTLKKWLQEIFLIDIVLKTNPWTHKIKDLNG